MTTEQMTRQIAVMMRVFITSLVLFAMLTSASAQDNHIYSDADAWKGVVQWPVVNFEVMDLEKWLREKYRNHTTPAQKVDAIIRFVVEKDGSNSNINIVLMSNQREIQSTYIKQELIRLFNLMPKWSPATKEGGVFGIPVRYQIEMKVVLESRKDRQVREKREKEEEAKIAREKANKIYDVVDDPPMFTVGDQGKNCSIRLLEWIKKNCRYPQTAKEKGIKGRVPVTFVIEKDGSVSNVEILRSLSPECDAEAIRLVKSMPKWEPGREDGAPVRVRYSVPVIFQ